MSLAAHRFDVSPKHALIAQGAAWLAKEIERERNPQPPTADEADATRNLLDKLASEDRAASANWKRAWDYQGEMLAFGLDHRIKRTEVKAEPLTHAQWLVLRAAQQTALMAEFPPVGPLPESLSLLRSHQQTLAALLEPFPIALRWALNARYKDLEAAHGWHRADWWLNTFHELHSAPVVDWRASDAEASDKGRDYAKQVATLMGQLDAGALNDGATAAVLLRQKLAFQVVAVFVDDLGLTPPSIKGRTTYAGALARLSSGKWWTSTLKRWRDQGLEAMFRSLGRVHQSAAYAVSNDGAIRQKWRREKTDLMLAELDAVSDEGEVIALAELIAKGPANPYIRFVELMTRVKGMSKMADAAGYEGHFLTWTLPSRYHANYENGSRNRKWQGETTNDGRKALQQLWQECRALFHKHGLRVYGQRGAEPHHDGCPHWHLLLFIHPHDVAKALAICRAKALQDCPDEDGAAERRFTTKLIERDASGALKAASYIAKYLTKNIAGAHLGQYLARSAQGDLLDDVMSPVPAADNSEGASAEAIAARVRAWASIWRIRQFQVFGLPPLGTYRELRRLGKTQQEDPRIEAARAAADVGDFYGYSLAIGGWDMKRNAPAKRGQLLLQLHRQPDERPNGYGEQRPDEIKGVVSVEALIAEAQAQQRRIDDEARLTAREMAAFENEGGWCVKPPKMKRRLMKRRPLLGLRPKPTELSALHVARTVLPVAITRRTRWTIARRAVAGPWTRVTNCNQHGAPHGAGMGGLEGGHGPGHGPPTEKRHL